MLAGETNHNASWHTSPGFNEPLSDTRNHTVQNAIKEVHLSLKSLVAPHLTPPAYSEDQDLSLDISQLSLNSSNSDGPRCESSIAPRNHHCPACKCRRWDRPEYKPRPDRLKAVGTAFLFEPAVGDSTDRTLNLLGHEVDKWLDDPPENMVWNDDVRHRIGEIMTQHSEVMWERELVDWAHDEPGLKFSETHCYWLAHAMREDNFLPPIHFG